MSRQQPRRRPTLIGPLNDDEIRAAAPALPFGESPRAARELRWDPTSRSNLLLAGSHGTGKSNAGDVLAAAARVQGSAVLGIRAQGAPDPRFTAFANGMEDAEQLLVELTQEMRRRMTAVRASGERSVEALPEKQRPPHLFLFVDGLARLPLQTKLPPEELRAARTEFYDYLRRSIDLLSRAGALLRIHVVVVTDRDVPKPPWNTGVIRLRNPGRGTYDTGTKTPQPAAVYPAPSAAQVGKALTGI
ncbi:P-loop NTPase family protein [Agromyces humi]|uniref:hypothetical protein n=1 Tax=Agromyces humi TaxID=1766800 RepID=UPI00135A6EDC|nr:hypothetical protein [Agromyces humi]